MVQPDQQQPQSKLKFRFSIRWLLLLTALACVAAYLVTWPDRVASRFVAHVNSRDWDAVLEICGDGEPVNFWYQAFLETEGRELVASRQHTSISDLCRLRRKISVTSGPDENGVSLRVAFDASPLGVTLRTLPDLSGRLNH